MQELPATLRHERWAELFASATVSLSHIELHDRYAVDYEDERYRWWKQNGGALPREVHRWWDLTAETIGRGVLMRRARVVSLPPSEYVRFEHAGTWQNVEAGEAVRWLARSLASDIALPGNDLWLIDPGLDSGRVLFNLFDGDGRPVGKQLTDDPAVVKLCADSFDAVWSRAADHHDFRID